MAIVAVERLARIRNRFVELFPNVATKPPLSAAAQAIEDWFEANRPNLSTAIDTATAPFGITFTNAQKKQLVRQWLFEKFEVGG